MAILADTNILLSIQNSGHPHYGATRAALRVLQVRGELLCTAPQNLIEFWAVSTRRLHENGLGMKIDQAAKELAAMRIHNIDSILTWNTQDFRRFPGITVLDPSAIVSA